MSDHSQELHEYISPDWSIHYGVGGNERAFRQEHLARTSPATTDEMRLDEMAETYYQSCDAYDARVCTGKSPITGEPMPMTPREFALINKHAREVREGLMYRYRLNEQQFHEAATRWYDRQPMKERRHE